MAERNWPSLNTGRFFTTPEVGPPGRLMLFSRLMQEVVPFNRPHDCVWICPPNNAGSLPWRRRNLNHVAPCGACALPRLQSTRRGCVAQCHGA